MLPAPSGILPDGSSAARSANSLAPFVSTRCGVRGRMPRTAGNMPALPSKSSCVVSSTRHIASDESISNVIGDWKHFQTRKHGIVWQEGYFDHRLRDDERGEQLLAKMNYIRQNPVVAGLCARAEDWPWIIDRSACGGSSSPLSATGRTRPVASSMLKQCAFGAILNIA